MSNKDPNPYYLKLYRHHVNKDHKDARSFKEYYIGSYNSDWHYDHSYHEPEKIFSYHRFKDLPGLITKTEQIDNPDWKPYARQCMISGNWEVPNWDIDDDKARFAHLIKTAKGEYLIRYIASDAHGKRGRLSEMKPGKYLQAFHPELGPEKIKEIATGIGNPPPLHWATTAEEIIKVYENGPNSCMSSEGHEYHGHVHPVAVYGDSDLKLAYITRGSEITARCLVWPERMRMGRAYGDAQRITKALEAEGYRYGKFDGAKVHAIKNKDGKGYIMPYVDGTAYAELKGDWFILGHGKISVQHTNGVCFDGMYCDVMEEYYPNDQMVYCHDTGNYISNEALDRGYGYRDAITGNVYRRDWNMVTLADGRMVHEYTFVDHQGFHDHFDGEYYLGTETPNVFIEDINEDCTLSNAEAFCFKHSNGLWYSEPEKVSEEPVQANDNLTATPAPTMLQAAA